MNQDQHDTQLYNSPSIYIYTHWFVLLKKGDQGEGPCFYRQGDEVCKYRWMNKYIKRSYWGQCGHKGSSPGEPRDCSVGSSQTEVEWVGPLHDPLTLSQQWVDGNNFSLCRPHVVLFSNKEAAKTKMFGPVCV